jgi:predicted DNA-binding transcriptional regulator AlpA
MPKKLLRMAEVAKLSGLTLHTCYTYKCHGLLPQPAMKIGPIPFYDRSEVQAAMKLNNADGRLNARKSVKAVKAAKAAAKAAKAAEIV